MTELDAGVRHNLCGIREGNGDAANEPTGDDDGGRRGLGRDRRGPKPAAPRVDAGGE